MLKQAEMPYNWGIYASILIFKAANATLIAQQHSHSTAVKKTSLIKEV